MLALLSKPKLDGEPGLLLFYYHRTVLETCGGIVLFSSVVSALDGFSDEHLAVLSKKKFQQNTLGTEDVHGVEFRAVLTTSVGDNGSFTVT